MGDKALVSVNGGAPRVLKVGESHQGVRLLAVGPQGVEILLEGRRHVLDLGQGVYPQTAALRGAAPDQGERVMLTADGRGHFLADGTVNGLPARFMVDTGASLVTLPASIARRAGVELANASPVTITTANGRAQARRVLINLLQIGPIRANLVEALVVEDEALSLPLLGMSFLNRTNMQREGDTLVLMQRY